VFESTARDFIERRSRAIRTFWQHSIRRKISSRSKKPGQSASRARAPEVDVFEPHYEGSSIVWGPSGSSCSATGSHQFAARAGHHLAPRQLSSGLNVFDELGDGFTLLDLGSPNAFVQEFRRAADALGIPLKVIETAGPTVGSFTKRRLFWCAPINLSPGRRIARPAIRPKS